MSRALGADSDEHGADELRGCALVSRYAGERNGLRPRARGFVDGAG